MAQMARSKEERLQSMQNRQFNRRNYTEKNPGKIRDDNNQLLIKISTKITQKIDRKSTRTLSKNSAKKSATRIGHQLLQTGAETGPQKEPKISQEKSAKNQPHAEAPVVKNWGRSWTPQRS